MTTALPSPHSPSPTVTRPGGLLPLQGLTWTQDLLLAFLTPEPINRESSCVAGGVPRPRQSTALLPSPHRWVLEMGDFFTTNTLFISILLLPLLLLLLFPPGCLRMESFMTNSSLLFPLLSIPIFSRVVCLPVPKSPRKMRFLLEERGRRRRVLILAERER